MDNRGQVLNIKFCPQSLTNGFPTLLMFNQGDFNHSNMVVADNMENGSIILPEPGTTMLRISGKIVSDNVDAAVLVRVALNGEPVSVPIVDQAEAYVDWCIPVPPVPPHGEINWIGVSCETSHDDVLLSVDYSYLNIEVLK